MARAKKAVRVRRAKKAPEAGRSKEVEQQKTLASELGIEPKRVTELAGKCFNIVVKEVTVAKALVAISKEDMTDIEKMYCASKINTTVQIIRRSPVVDILHMLMQVARLS